MGTLLETGVASEVAEEGADDAGSAACVVAGRGTCGGSRGGYDDLPMRNSRRSASSSRIPVMAAP
jgi:hypothetical protein